MYYIFIQNEKTNGCGQCKILNEDYQNYEVTEEVYNSFSEHPEWYEWNGTDIVKKTEEVIEQELEAEREEGFKKEFFHTSLGWVRREVTMSDGSKKSFLTDLYPSIAAAVNSGIEVPLLTYQEPDYTQELTTEYMETLQQKVIATAEFVTECATQLLSDFQG